MKGKVVKALKCTVPILIALAVIFASAPGVSVHALEIGGTLGPVGDDDGDGEDFDLGSTEESTTAIAEIASVTLSKTSYTYTGSAFKPTVTVKDSAGKTISSSYYTVTYSNNKNVGTASVKVVFKGNYSGTVTRTFTIKAQAVKSSNVTLSKTSYVYTGKALKPGVTAKNSSGNKISSSYYTVTYKSNKNVGKATVTIKFKGNYSGTIKKTFTIKPKATSITKKTAKSKGFALTWKKISSQVTGYQIQYSTSSKFTSGTTTTKTVTSYKTTGKTYTKLKAKKKYYIRIRTYKTVSGTKYYSAWSKTKTVTTKK